MRTKPRRETVKNSLSKLYSWSWLPTLAFALLPALVIRNKWNIIAADATWQWGAYMVGDIRSWWKAAFVVGIAAWMLCTAGWRGRDRLSAFVALAAAGTLAATLLSPFPYTRWIGYTALYEGAIVLLAYLVALRHTAGTESAAVRLRIIRATLAVAAVNIALGILSGVHRNFWESDWGAWVIGLPQSMIRHNFTGTNMASGTVYQPNHYGMLMSMLGALSLGMISAESRPLWKRVWSASYALCFVALLFSRSRAGTMTFLALTAVAVAAKIITHRENILKKTILKPVLKAAAAAVVAGAVLLILPLGIGDAAKLFLERSAQLSIPLPLNSPVADVSLADNIITVTAQDGNTLRIGKLSGTSWYAESGGIGAGGASRTLLRPADRPGGWRRYALPGFSAATLDEDAAGHVLLRAPDTNLEFFALGTELFAVDETKTDLALRTEIPPSLYVPSGREGFLAGRGYIWARSFEKGLERPFFGWGPGSLALVFPNRELLNRQRYSAGEGEDKGHSLYLTFFVQNGIAGTILYFLPFVYAAYVLAKSRSRLRAPLLLALAAYAVCGLTNDSTVGVTPLFCVFAGLAAAEGKAANREINKVF